MKFSLKQSSLKIGASAVVAVVIFSGCKKKEEEEIKDPLLGLWNGTTCSALLSEEEIIGNDESQYTAGGGANYCDFDVPGTDPDTLEDDDPEKLCYTSLSGYFVKNTVEFTDAGEAGTTHNQMVLTQEVFHNLDADVAAECDADDLFAVDVRTYSYQLGEGALEATDNVNTDNDFPDGAKALNMQLVSVEKTYVTEDSVIDSMNNTELCEYDSWASEKAKDVTDKDNCGAAYTKLMSTAFVSNLGSAGWEDDGGYTSPLAFRSGFEEYRIVKVDAKVLSLGVAPSYDVLPTADETQEYLEQAGTSERSRTREFGLEFDLDE
jgi:hypothetical protein